MVEHKMKPQVGFREMYHPSLLLVVGKKRERKKNPMCGNHLTIKRLISLILAIPLGGCSSSAKGICVDN